MSPAYVRKKTPIATECAKTLSRLPWKVMANFHEPDTKVVSLVSGRDTTLVSGSWKLASTCRSTGKSVRVLRVYKAIQTVVFVCLHGCM